MKEDKKHELIDKYLHNTLQTEELIQFEQQLTTDTDFEKTVQLLQHIRHVVKDETAIAIQQKMQTLPMSHTQRHPPKRRIRHFKQWAIAATILIIATFGITFWFIQPPPSQPQALYTQYYHPWEGNNIIRGSSKTEELGLTAYRQGDFNQAIIQLETVLAKSPNNSKSLYFLGHSYLNLKPANATKALFYFQMVIKMDNSIFIPSAQWYSALIYLKQNHYAKAIEILESLKADNQSGYSKQARKLLKELNN